MVVAGESISKVLRPVLLREQNFLPTDKVTEGVAASLPSDVLLLTLQDQVDGVPDDDGR